MKHSEIAPLRLVQQGIFQKKSENPAQAVARLGAVQAQDFQMARWAVGCRTEVATDAQIDEAIDQAKIFRTHILRPTWHFVAAEDYRWMLQIGTPQVQRTLASANKKLGLPPEILEKSNRLIEKMLLGRQLTRDEIMANLARENIPTDSITPAHLMMHAELTGLVANGSWRGKQLTYALLDERLPAAPPRPLDECLALLARRFFGSHAPATLADFAWWSGLSLGDSRRGVAMLHGEFFSEKIEEKEYWLPQSADFETAKKVSESVFLLPAFDEFLIAYADRSASLDAARFSSTITANGIFKPVVVVGGQVVGLWRRSFKKDKVLVGVDFFEEKLALPKVEIERAAGQFAEFLGLKLEVV